LYDKTQGIKEITENGIITQDGKKIEVDLIVYSTGYDATDNAIAYPVIGQKIIMHCKHFGKTILAHI
jgi:NADH dehydrogenase FAD-containing subunit